MPAGHYDRTRIPRRGRPGFLRAILGDLDRDWMSQAVCRLMPLSEVDALFFPINGRSHEAKRSYSQKVTRAKRICASCPVKIECEGYRAAISDENGVWGGRDELDRDPQQTRHEMAAELEIYQGRPPTPRHCPGSGAIPTDRRGDRASCPGCGRLHSVRRDGFIFNHFKTTRQLRDLED